jgi:hypothetical protein
VGVEVGSGVGVGVGGGPAGAHRLISVTLFQGLIEPVEVRIAVWPR